MQKWNIEIEEKLTRAEFGSNYDYSLLYASLTPPVADSVPIKQPKQSKSKSQITKLHQILIFTHIIDLTHTVHH
jgi:hypothetical protein